MRKRSSAAMLSSAIASLSLIHTAHAGKLVISEVLYNEVGGPFAGEWIEIYNGSDTAIDLSNYKAGDEETKGQTSVTEALYQFPDGASIAPGEVQVVSSFASRFKEVYGFAPTYEFGSSVTADAWVDDSAVANMRPYLAWDPDGAKLNMSNTDDQALIVDGSDTVIDGVNWGNNVFLKPGLTAVAGDGQSYQRLDPLTDSDTAADWSLVQAAPAGAFWASVSKSNPGTLGVVPASTWSADGDGSWIVGTNWSGGIPNAAGASAVLGNTITAARTVSVPNDVTLGSMKLDSAFAYTIDGSAKLIFNGSGGAAKVQVVQGGHTIIAPVTLASATTFDIADASALTLTADLTSMNIAVTKSGNGTLTLNRLRAASLNITAGTVAMKPARTDDSTSVVSAVSIAAGAKLDLADNAIVLDYASTATASPLADVVAAIKDGRLTSSKLSDARYAIGTIDTASKASLTHFAGFDLDATAIVALVTLKGDATMDGTVNFDDLIQLAQNYNKQTGGTWATGDTTGDGVVNFDDLIPLAKNYNKSFSAAGTLGSIDTAFSTDWALAQSLVPEPTSLMTISGAATLLRRRRR